jgi:hypothetical protein
MAPDCVRNMVELHRETKSTVRRLNCPNDLDQLVLNVVADLADTGRYADDRSDTRLLADCRRYLMVVGRTLTAHEVDTALLRWSRLNASLIAGE